MKEIYNAWILKHQADAEFVEAFSQSIMEAVEVEDIRMGYTGAWT